MPSPLGRYSEAVTALLTVFLVVAAVVGHLIEPNGDLTFIDAAALLALGATYGKLSAANGYAASTMAAHRRLDAIGAPPVPTENPTNP
jgi:hypothetical protein